MARSRRMDRFKLTDVDPELMELIQLVPHPTVGAWAAACALRVLFYFEEAFDQDERPRQAIEALKEWIDGRPFSMDWIRSVSLAAHAAARDVGADTPARSAARAAGQAVATAHVRTHSIAAANYALQAIDRAAYSADLAGRREAVAAERAWQQAWLRRATGKPE